MVQQNSQRKPLGPRDTVRPTPTANALTMRRLAGIFRPHKRKLLTIALLAVAATLSRLSYLLLIRALFDRGIGHRELRAVVLCSAGMVLVLILSSLIERCQTVLTLRLCQTIIGELRIRLYSHLQRVSLSFYTHTESGELLARFSSDIGGLQGLVKSAAPSFITNFVSWFGSVLALLYIAPALSLITMAALPIVILTANRKGKFRRETNQELQKANAHLSSLMHQTLSINGILLIRNLGRQDYVRQCVSEQNARVQGLEMSQALTPRRGVMWGSGLLCGAIPALIYLAAGWQIIHRAPILGFQMTAGTLVAFISLQNRLFSPTRKLVDLHSSLRQGLVYLDRVFEYLEIPADVEESPGAIYLSPKQASGRVQFENVSFTYVPARSALRTLVSQEAVVPSGYESEKPILKRISFRVEAGKTLAIVGPSGAGKTTISYLLSRIYDATAGTVSIDGHNVRSLAAKSISDLVSVVTQDTFLIHDTVRNNLLFARLDASDADIVAAAKAAFIHDRICELPLGYDTVVGERGFRFSGGEKQRLAIARAMLRDSPILILDEATSSLDRKSERLVQDALNSARAGRTTLVIAHRISTIARADSILVLDRGEVVDRGTFAELTARCPLFSSLAAA